VVSSSAKWVPPLLVLLLFSSPVVSPAWAQRSVGIPPSGTATWQELQARERARSSSDRREKRIAPLRRGPRPRDLSPPPGVELHLTPSGGALEPTATTPTLNAGFQGLPDNDLVIPPDTMGAVGPSHVMTMLNSAVRIQSKAGGLIGTVSARHLLDLGNGPERQSVRSEARL
jgi:hypothetical protein